MKREKGFTLVELIAVLVILSILIVAIAAVFMNIRRSVLEKEKSNLITYLETKAIEYANDTNVTTVSVETLINLGMVKPDDETDIYDPVTRESLNCYIINLVWKDGEYKATFGSNIGRDGLTCNKYNSKKDLMICRVDENDCYEISETQWFNEDIVLGLKFRDGKMITEESGFEINWKSNSGVTSMEDTIKTNVNLLANIKYNVIIVKKDETGETTQLVNIDKENPVISNVKIIKQNEWTNEGKDVEIKVSDMNGSGIDKIYLSNNEINDCSKVGYDINVSDGLYKTKLQSGVYNVCVKDKAGNFSKKPYTFKIEMVDTTPTDPVIIASDGIESGNFHSKDYTLSWKSTNEGSQDLIYYYGTDKNKMTNKGASTIAKKNQYNVTMYVKACTSKSNLCSGISSYVINVDTTPTNPVITASDGLVSGKYHDQEYALSWKSTNEGSQDLTYYYGTDSSKLNDTGTYMSAKKDQYGVYVYVKACTAYNKCSGISKYLLNLDNEAPIINITSGGDGSNYFTFAAAITDNQSGVVAYAVTGYETPKNWLPVTNTKSLNISRDITWKESGRYYIFAKDAVGNVSKLKHSIYVRIMSPVIADHEVFYNCSSGKIYVSALLLGSDTNNVWYYTSTNKNAPALNDSGWSLGCDITKYSGTCPSSKISLNRYGDTYVWAKACNSNKECTIAPIGHAVCSNRQNPEGITYDSKMADCSLGWLTYDIYTDKYSCMTKYSHAQNISDKNLEVPCAENSWTRQVPVLGTDYCCPENYSLNKNYKIGSYYACEINYGTPKCSSDTILSTNNGYCISK